MVTKPSIYNKRIVALTVGRGRHARAASSNRRSAQKGCWRRRRGGTVRGLWDAPVEAGQADGSPN